MRVGIIGLGLMGQSFARNLLAAGHEVVGWSRNSLLTAEVVRMGGIASITPCEVFEKTEAVISMLSDDAAFVQVFLDSGLINSLPDGIIHINMATISVACAQKLETAHQKRRQHFVMAPVLGNSILAQSAKLHILTAGPLSVIDRCRPIFQAIGTTVRVIGDQPEMACITKITMNFLLCTAVTALAEAHSLSKAYGIDPQILQEIINNTFLGSPAYQTYGEKIARSEFEPPAFRLALAQKDLHLASAASHAADLSLPLAACTADRLDAAVASGHGDKDLAAVALIQDSSTKRMRAPV